MYGTIYIIRNNINNKVYVGQTTQPVEIRFKQHLKLLKTNSKQYIHRAIKKHGKENFYYEVLSEGIDELSELNRLEEIYISQHNSLAPNGYNLCPGGQEWRRKPKFDDTIGRDIVVKYKDGLTLQQLAEVYNVSRRCISDTILRQGCELRVFVLQDRTSIVTKEIMEELYVNTKMMMKDIAKKLGVNVSAINRAKRRYNLKRI